jgi:hypothetical protein
MLHKTNRLFRIANAEKYDFHLIFIVIYSPQFCVINSSLKIIFRKNIKFLLLAVVTMLMSANFLSAQRVYNADEMNGKLLYKMFQNTALKTSNVNDRFLDVTSTYTYNIYLDNNNRFFTISAKYKFSDLAKNQIYRNCSISLIKM